MDLSQELDTVLRQEFPHLQDLPPTALAADTPLFGPEGIGLDSIDALELVVILRRRFKVEIPDRNTGERAFKSFGALVEFVRGAKKR
jgi:acyl carrier protein